MSVVDKMKQGHASVIKDFLMQGETIEEIYALMLDFACITNKRVIFVDKSFLSTSQMIYTIPYENIDGIGLEKGKIFSLSNKVDLIAKGKGFELKFNKGEDVIGFYRTVTERICG